MLILQLPLTLWKPAGNSIAFPIKKSRIDESVPEEADHDIGAVFGERHACALIQIVTGSEDVCLHAARSSIADLFQRLCLQTRMERVPSPIDRDKSSAIIIGEI